MMTTSDGDVRKHPHLSTGLSRPLAVLLGVAATFIVVAGLRSLSGIIGPVFLAVVITIAAHPIRPWFQRHGLPGWLGSLVGLVTIYAGLIALTLALVVSGAQFATQLPKYQPEMEQLVNEAARWLKSLGIDQQQIDQIAGAFDVGKLVSLAGQLISGLVGALSSLFLVVTLILFMVADAARVPQRLLQLDEQHRPMALALSSFASGTRRYLVVSTVFGLIVAVFDTFALMWLGVPLAIVWGLLSFITNYIPNIGFVIGVIPPAILGLLVGGPGTLLAVIVAYSVLNVVIQTIIQPKIVGDAVGLTGTITMISLVFWAYALGAIGALMAVPLTLLTKAVLVDADPGSAWMLPLITGGTEAKREGDQARGHRRRPWRRGLP